MYPDIEQRDFYPRLNGLSKIIKKDYLKIQGPQRCYKNCVEHFLLLFSEFFFNMHQEMWGRRRV